MIIAGCNLWKILVPGVTLGENTVVAAGAVVTKSFPCGHCVIGGVPAKIIKMIDLFCTQIIIENNKNNLIIWY